MSPCAISGLIFLTVLGTLSAHSGSSGHVEDPQCPRSEGVSAIQTACSEENDALLEAEFNKQRDLVCEKVMAMMECVAEKVPRCFNLHSSTSTYYMHSPYMCEISQEEVLRLQSVVQKSQQSMKVDVVPVDGSSSGETTPDSAPQPWTHGQGGGAKGDGYDPHTGKGEVEHSNLHKGELGNKGKREEQKAPDNDRDHGVQLSTLGLSLLLGLAVLSSRLPWRLVS